MASKPRVITWNDLSHVSLSLLKNFLVQTHPLWFSLSHLIFFFQVGVSSSWVSPDLLEKFSKYRVLYMSPHSPKYFSKYWFLHGSPLYT
jgi:hypothetical protein